MPVKLADVAKRANVSVSTVSRVVNNKDKVDEKTRKRVMEAVKVLNFYPNDIARNLRSNNTKTIAVVVPDLSNYFYASVIKGIESVSQKNGYSVIVCNSDENIEREKQYAQMLMQKHISGLIIATAGGFSDLYKQYLDIKIPVVFFDNSPNTEQPFDFVSIDNVKASCELVEHMVSLGHENIAILTGSLVETSACERLDGWKQTLRKHKLPIIEENIAVGEFTVESGIELMRKIISLENRPTAVFAANNFLAYGAIQAIFEAGLKIPEDIALVCFDAIDRTGLMKPQITTSIQPSEEIGTIAGKLLVEKIENKQMKTFQKIILDSKLLIKDSTIPR